MATVNLGSIKFKWKGTYAGGTAYTIDDVVSYNGSSYICIQASTGNLPTNATYFEQMSQAGTNGTDGTDLTTTLTTQGDIVYRDASGLARLGAGTSGQVLQTNGTGANPSWGTVSSDFVKLASGTNVDATTYSIDGYYSSTYNTYKLIFNTVRNSSAGNILSRVNVGGSANSSNIYKYQAGRGYQDSGGVAFDNGVNAWNDSHIRLNGDGVGNTYSGNLEIDIFDPLTTNGEKHIIWNLIYMNSGGGAHLRMLGGATAFTTSATTGFTIFSDSGNFKADHFALYGLKA